MTIKKTLSIKRPTVGAGSPVSAEGGAESHSVAPTVADRYRLDTPDATQKKSAGGGVGAMAAVLAGVAALIVAGILTFVMYQHWTFLQGA